MAEGLRDVGKKREQRYSYGLTLLRECIEKKHPGTPPLEQAGDNTVLRVENLSLDFGQLRALVNVNLEVREAEILAVIGPNGAGKTCLLNVISGFYRAQKGEIFFAGQRISRYPSYKIAELGLCRTFQNIGLYTGLSVIDNIIAGRHPHIPYHFLAGMLYFP